MWCHSGNDKNWDPQKGNYKEQCPLKYIYVEFDVTHFHTYVL